MPPRRAVFLLALAYAGFVSLGLPDGLLGIAWPSMRAQFGLALDALGPLLVATTTGYVLASFASGRLLARASVGALLAASCFATALALAGYATAPAWAGIVAFGLLAGLGAGAIDAGLNTYVATHHSPRTLNWLHACYGVGAAAGPVLMTSVLMAGHPWQRGYAIVAAAQLALALAFAATRSSWPQPAPPRNTPPVPRGEPQASGESQNLLPKPATGLGMAAFFVYVGLEQSAGAWAYSFLTEARGVPMARAGTFVSIYWGGLMAGRLVFGLVANRVALATLVRGVLVAMLAATLLVAFDPFPAAGEIGLALLGFACGPVFPSLIAATPARVGAAHAAHAVGLQIAAAALGQALVPWGVGALARAHGLGIVAPALVALALLLVAIHEALARTALASDAMRRSART